MVHSLLIGEIDVLLRTFLGRLVRMTIAVTFIQVKAFWLTVESGVFSVDWRDCCTT